MSGMAEVLAAHWSASTHTDSKPFVDKCDGCGAVVRSWGDEAEAYVGEYLAAHQSAMLSAAGFGPVKEAGAVALEEAAAELARLPYVKPNYPDRTEYERILAVRRGNTDAWLRARAAAVRGEG
jgi:hypothetical protein